jgi:hypothetical protein
MPLVEGSREPASGDSSDYNRNPSDGRHRSHRFVAANSMMPQMLKLEGWQDQVRLTEKWLQGTYEIPEIREKWAEGPIVRIAIQAPQTVAEGDSFAVRVVLTSNKVGHDYPTGPLDIIQSWVELRVTDEAGKLVYASGRRDENNFIEPGSFLFKAEPVDQYGNLIDRHNLWEMVGVRYRRSLFPGYSDMVDYLASCSGSQGRRQTPESPREFQISPIAGGRYQVSAILQYRKVDQFLLNFLLGKDSGVTAPVIEVTRATATIEVKRKTASAG